MKKRILSIALALCLVFSLLPVTALAADAPISGKCGNNLTWVLDESGTLTISGTWKMFDYNTSPNDEGVFVPNAPWRDYYKSIKSVVIEEGVTSIGNCAFVNCANIASVTIPDSVTSIGRAAFMACRSLTNVTIGSGVQTINASAFDKCSSLTDITIPKNVTVIGDGVFEECTGLKNAVILGNITSIGNRLFYGCSSLENVTLGNGVTSITREMFDNCKNLTSITIPDGVTSIDAWAFSACFKLASVTIPVGVASIGNGAFNVCVALKDVYYNGTPEQWAAIEIGENNDSLQNAELHCTGISYNGSCGADLTWALADDGTLTVSGTGEMYDYSFSANADGVNVTTAPWREHHKAIKSVVIEDGVTNVGIASFYGCSSITSVAIPEGVTSIGHSAFYDCTGMTSVALPDSVTKLEDSAFYNCSSLTAVTIPGNVTSISNAVFYDCSALTSVTIGAGVTYISDFMFGKCSGLTSVTIPDSVKRIGEGAFDGCANLKDVHYSGSVDEWAAINIGISNEPLAAAEKHCVVKFNGTCGENLTWVLADDGTLTISGTGKMYNYSSTKYPDGNFVTTAPWRDHYKTIKSVVIEDSVTSVGSDAFRGCTGITTATTGEGATIIDSGAFEGCTGLTTATIGNSVLHIGVSSFYGCSSLTSVTIGSSVATIGHSAFYGCSSLASLTLPDSVVSFSEAAFRGCSSLTSVVIPDRVRVIDEGLFSQCSSLKSVTIPLSVRTIGWGAFLECDALENVYYAGSPEQWAEIEIYASNTQLNKAKITYAVDHTHVYTDTVTAPTCTEQGYTTHTCICGKTYVDSYVPALNHDIIHHDGKAATCTEKGWKAYDTCSRCDYTTYEEIAATGHHHKASVTAPTCTEKGYTTHTCTCGDSYVDNYISALGHSYKNGSCTRCGAVAPNYIAVPTLSITTSSGKPKISWNAVDGATKYWVYRSTDGVNFKYYDKTTKTSYTNSSTTIGTTYYYKVKAVKTANGKDIASDYSATKSIKCAPAAPTVSISRVNGKPKLSWKAVTGATKYWIYRSTDGKNFKYYDMTTKTSYTNSGAASGTKYYYKVKAVAVVNGNNVASAYSSTKNLLTTLATPSVSITTSNGKPKVTWSAVKGADKYYVYRSTDGKNFSYYDTTTKTSYTNTGAKKNTKYYYKIKAVCASNSYANSAQSKTVSIKATK